MSKRREEVQSDERPPPETWVPLQGKLYEALRKIAAEQGHCVEHVVQVILEKHVSEREAGFRQDEQWQSEITDIYDLYRAFVSHLPYKDALEYSREEFRQWWNELDPATRALVESNCLKGYRAVISEGAQEVGKFIKQYEKECEKGED